MVTHGRVVFPSRRAQARRRLGLAWAIAACAGIVAARPARADPGLGVEVFGGWQDLQLSTSSVSGAVAGNEGTALFGGDLLARWSALAVGLSVDKTVTGSAEPWAGSILAGLLLDLPLSLRIDALGEVGRRAHDFGDLFDSTGATFLGLRPGVSLLLFPTPLRVGVSGLVRWPTSGGSFGSPDFGFVARVGWDFM